MKIQLFGKHIEPACQYCELGRLDKPNHKVDCPKHGMVELHFHCKRFQYAPLKRTPRRAAPLPQYSKEDFKL